MQIYLIENINNKKIYIGKTKNDLQKRLKQHVYNAKKLNTPLSRAIRKYGENNFIIKLLETTDDHLREVYWIKEYINIFGKQNIYNATKGGDGGGDTYTNNPNLKLIKKKLSKIQLVIQNKKEIRNKKTLRMKERWKDSEYQEKVKQDMLNTWNNNTARKKTTSKRSKALWKNKKFKLKHKKAMEDKWKNTEYRLKVSNLIKLSKVKDREKAKEKWKKLYGHDLEKKIITLIKMKTSLKDMMFSLKITNKGRIQSILQMFFNYKSLNKIKSHYHL